MFEFGKYCFIKSKFKFQNFLSEIQTKDFQSIETSARLIEMMKKIILESLDDSIAIRFLFDQTNEHCID